MASFPDVDEQLAYLRKGAAKIIRESDLRERLEKSRTTGKPMRVKAGFDPTAPDLHLGHTVLIRKLKHFQDLGHTVIFLIGDFTGADRRSHRPHGDAPAAHARADRRQRRDLQGAGLQDPRPRQDRGALQLRVARQAGLRGHHPAGGEVHRLADAGARGLPQALQEEKPIALHEMLYPLAQGYDSVALEADVELGGTDQKFNLLIGRELQRHYGQPPQIVLTMPLLEGTRRRAEDVEVATAITSASPKPPQEMFGKVMSISDELMWRYYELLTDVSIADIERMKSEVAGGTCAPDEAEAGAG